MIHYEPLLKKPVFTDGVLLLKYANDFTPKIPMGKYKGQHFDVLKKDFKYVMWLLNQEWFYQKTYLHMLKYIDDNIIPDEWKKSETTTLDKSQTGIETIIWD